MAIHVESKPKQARASRGVSALTPGARPRSTDGGPIRRSGPPPAAILPQAVGDRATGGPPRAIDIGSAVLALLDRSGPRQALEYLGDCLNIHGAAIDRLTASVAFLKAQRISTKGGDQLMAAAGKKKPAAPMANAAKATAKKKK